MSMSTLSAVATAKTMTPPLPAAGKSILESISADLPIEHDARFLEERFRQTGWLADYSIQFRGCHTLHVISEEGADRNGNDEYGYDTSAVSPQHLVRFRLCKKGKCNRQCYGDYVTSMREFVGGYLEFQNEIIEEKCETIRENCYCQYVNDDEVCERQCYQEAGMEDECMEAEEDAYGNRQEEFEVDRYLECEEMEVENNQNNNGYGYGNGNNNANRFYIGPYCSANGKHVHLGVFTDGLCTNLAPKGTYEKYSYMGESLPYSSSSIVSSDCIDCEEVDNEQNYNGNYNNNYNNNNNNANGNNYWNDEREINEVCERSYEQAAKCEKGMGKIVPYPRTNDCSFVQKIVYLRDDETSNNSLIAGSFAILFAISTVGLLFYIYKLRHDDEFDGTVADVKRESKKAVGKARDKFTAWRAKKHNVQEDTYSGLT